MTQRNSYLKRKYGITEEQYEELKSAQGGKCFICLKTPRKRALDVDHNHKTNEIRGLLCNRCNHGLLGHAHDNPEMLKRALQYLEDPPARYVLVDIDDSGQESQAQETDSRS